MPKGGVVIVRVGLFAANSLLIGLVATNREPVGGADRPVEIDAILAFKAAGCSIAISTVWWIAVLEVDAAVLIGGTLCTANGGRIAVCAREE